MREMEAFQLGYHRFAVCLLGLPGLLVILSYSRMF
jgi:hypothetical protein